MAKKNQPIIWRAPFEIPVASDYKAGILLFIRRVESQLKRKNTELKKNGVSAEKRNEYLKHIVETEYAAISRKQNQKHYNDLIRITHASERRESDKADLLSLISDISSEIDSLVYEYDKIEELYRDHNPLYQGRLIVDGISWNKKTKGGSNDE